MGDKFRTGDITGSAVAMGRGARAVRMGDSGRSETVSALLTELDRLEADLDRHEDGPAVERVRVRVEDLRESVTEDVVDPAQVGRSWKKLLSAGVQGLAVAANVAQIAQLVQALG